MKVLCYRTSNNGVGKRLQDAIESAVAKENTEICRNLEALSGRLRLPTHDLNISILLAKNKSELLGLLTIRDLLLNLRIILILPDGDKETIAIGHSFFPRFLSYADGDLKDVVAVLQKMLQNKNINHT